MWRPYAACQAFINSGRCVTIRGHAGHLSACSAGGGTVTTYTRLCGAIVATKLCMYSPAFNVK